MDGLVWKHCPDGGFIAAVPERGWAAYCYPSSPGATRAKKEPKLTAEWLAGDMESELGMAWRSKEVREAMDRWLAMV